MSDRAFLVALLAASLGLNVFLGLSLGHRAHGSHVSEAQKLNYVGPRIGSSVGPLAVRGPGGELVQLGFSGAQEATLLYVFSPTCIWCKRNTVSINSLYARRGDKMRFLGLAISDEGLEAYLAANPLPFPVYSGLSKDVTTANNFVATPATVLVGSDGTVSKGWGGAYTGAVRKEIESYFEVRLPDSATNQ